MIALLIGVNVIIFKELVFHMTLVPFIINFWKCLKSWNFRFKYIISSNYLVSWTGYWSLKFDNPLRSGNLNPLFLPLESIWYQGYFWSEEVPFSQALSCSLLSLSWAVTQSLSKAPSHTLSKALSQALFQALSSALSWALS